MKTAPTEPDLRELWVHARSAEGEGSVGAEQQRGRAKEFLQALGGLAAVHGRHRRRCRSSWTRRCCRRARIDTEPTTTRYGETGARIKGVELVQPLQGHGNAKSRRKHRPKKWWTASRRARC
ncbi:hypothetical protein [Pelomonas cellulosilytica]|uniref:Uncharacterized protein n=1 Tax=Pelomonas cellulosilytica TaxID=2906762 RepID=A0ABS8Y4B7_9BURK|nr:hypothetical protein [Pelomonas sp. P8]MCE4558074.1 hypothetical protein [Pelomonas sp. P8]